MLDDEILEVDDDLDEEDLGDELEADGLDDKLGPIEEEDEMI
jgi:hypothetical protein